LETGKKEKEGGVDKKGKREKRTRSHIGQKRKTAAAINLDDPKVHRKSEKKGVFKKKKKKKEEGPIIQEGKGEGSRPFRGEKKNLPGGIKKVKEVSTRGGGHRNGDGRKKPI